MPISPSLPRTKNRDICVQFPTEYPLVGNFRSLLHERLNHMYNTEGVDSVATITELRSKTSDLIDHVRDTDKGILIQKNNEPHAVLISWETYKAIKEKVNLDEL